MIRSLFHALLLISFSYPLAHSAEPTPATPPSGPPSPDYKLVWSDEFDGKVLDASKWKHRYLGPRKDGVNDEESVTLDGEGHLSISTRKVGEKYHTGMIATDPASGWKYGYFETRVKLQKQPGLWSAFWMMSNKMSAVDKGEGNVDDTATNGAEIDIYEYLGREGNKIHHALHWNGYHKFHKSGHKPAEVPGLTEGWHTVALEWTPEKYSFFVDGKLHWETKDAIAETEEYIILSCEVGKWGGDISKAQLPDAVLFDYVRVYQKK